MEGDRGELLKYIIVVRERRPEIRKMWEVRGGIR